MTAILTSSPCIYGAPRAIVNPENGFADNLRRCLPDKIRCLFIASSPDDYGFTERVAAEMRACFEEAGFAITELSILDRRNQNDAQMLIWKSDFIILAGGHVPTQNAFFQEIGLDVLLQDFAGVIMGISAGTMNSAETVYVQPEEEGESDPDFERFAPGLGLTRANVCPHYQKVKDNILDGLRLFEDITYADSMDNTFFALPDGSYILCDEDGETLFGEAYRIRNGILEKVCEDGESVNLEELY